MIQKKIKLIYAILFIFACLLAGNGVNAQGLNGLLKKMNKNKQNANEQSLPVPPTQKEKYTPKNNTTPEEREYASVFYFHDYSLSDPQLSQKIEKDMSGAVTPVGLQFIEGDMEIMCLAYDLFQMEAWSVDYFSGAEAISNGITDLIQNQGLTPMGIGFNGDQLYVVSIKGNTQITAWQLVESEQDLQDVSNDISPYLDQNYIPVGITLYGNWYYTLLLQVPSTTAKSWYIEGYDNYESMKNTIQQNIEKTIIPFGYIDAGVYNVLYIGF